MTKTSAGISKRTCSNPYWGPNPRTALRRHKLIRACIESLEQRTLLTTPPAESLNPVISGPDYILEDSPYTLNLSVTGPGQDTIASWTINWGDGTTEPGSAGDNIHTYADNGDYTLIVTAATQDTSYDASKPVTISNADPRDAYIVLIDLTADSGKQGFPLLLTTTATDAAGDLLNYSWNITRNGVVYPVFAEKEYTFTPDEDGRYFVTLTVTDDDGGSSTDTDTLIIGPDSPPITISGPEFVDEVSTFTLTLGPAPDTITSWIVHWGDGQTETFDTPGDKTHVYGDGPDTMQITVDVVDPDGTHLNAAGHSLTVNNVAPTIALEGEPKTDEGSTYTLILGPVTDPVDEPVTSWIVHWGDGQTETFDTFGPKTHVYADGPGTAEITVDLVDDDGTHEGAGRLTVAVNNVAPSLTLTTGKILRAGTPIALNLSATDPGNDASSFVINWGDGTATQPASLDDNVHTYSAAGDYTVTVTTTDEDGTYTATQTLTLRQPKPGPLPANRPVRRQADPIDPGRTALFVGGTPDSDTISIQRGRRGGIQVIINGVSQGVFRADGRIIVYGGAGDDTITVNSGIDRPVELDGGEGDDVLTAGGGSAILVGGKGDDSITGGQSRDMLIGGAGRDWLDGGDEDDILIAASLDIAEGLEPLRLAMREWLRTDKSAAQRIKHLRTGGGFNGAVRISESLFRDDARADRLRPGQGDFHLVKTRGRKTITDRLLKR